MHKYAILLGRLGDVVLISRFSKLAPNRYNLITSPEYTGVAKLIGEFHSVESYTSAFSNFNPDNASNYVDLHNHSLEVKEYKYIIKHENIPLTCTSDRALWLGISAKEHIQPRDHKVEPLLSYWARLLCIETNSIGSSTLPQLCLESSLKDKTKIAVALSFQSSAKHKILSVGAQKIVINFFLKKGVNLALIEGPGDETDNEIINYIRMNNIDLIKISSPEDALNNLKKCDLLVCVDNGLRHLAAAFSINTFVFYGPTTPKICGAGIHEFAFVSSLICAPCGNVVNCPHYDIPKCLTEEYILDIINLMENAWGTIYANNT